MVRAFRVCGVNLELAIFLGVSVLDMEQSPKRQWGKSESDLSPSSPAGLSPVLTKLAALASEIALKLGVETALDRDMQEIKQNIAPDAVLDEIVLQPVALSRSTRTLCRLRS